MEKIFEGKVLILDKSDFVGDKEFSITNVAKSIRPVYRADYVLAYNEDDRTLMVLKEREEIKRIDKLGESDIVSSTYDYKGYHFQRLNKDYLWYITLNNKIVNCSQYRHDLESWIDHQIKTNENTKRN